MMGVLASMRRMKVAYVGCGLGCIAYAFRHWRGEPFAETYPRLLAELQACFGGGERPMAVVRERLRGLSNGG